MKKKKLKVTMITSDTKDEYTTIASYNEEENILMYQEKKDIVTDVEIDLNKRKLIRNNKNLIMKYEFKINGITTNQIYLKDIDKYIDIKIETKKYNCDNNKLEIEYILIDSNDLVYFKIEY